MAVEALEQIAEDQELLIPLHGFKIENLRISSAMIIPEEGSIETLLNLRVLSSSSNASPLRYDFRISSITEEGKFSEHAAGMISLVIPNDPNKERRSIKEIKGRISNAKSWYAALSLAGVVFGPNFQTLSRICLIPEKHKAIASIALHTTKQMMPDQSRYAIHPTTLDGCLQLSVMAANGNAKSSAKAFLPVSVDELTIWNGSSSDPSLDKATIYARGDAHGLRSIHGSAKVFDNEGRLLVKGKVSFLSLEGGLKQSEKPAQRQPYFRLVWKPDANRLGNQCSPELDPLRSTFSSPSGLKDLLLEDYMELLAHKGSPLSIFYIGLESVRGGIVTLLGGSSEPIFSRLILACLDVASLEQAKNEFSQYESVEFCLFDIEKTLEEQSIEADTYDLVILAEVSFGQFQ